jgi:uncharacterized protein YfaT (DUF1175 family)
MSAFSLNLHQHLSSGDLLVGFHGNLGQHTIKWCGYFVLHLHGFQNNDNIAFADGVTGLANANDAAWHGGDKPSV